ncbi:MAG TPA: MarR family transcriptional regulator [Nocardioidaceae bacterium]|nr:MarR family transcriptional regulator [Nocardioidaceae bacterium]
MTDTDEQAQTTGMPTGGRQDGSATRVMGLTQELLRRMVALAGDLASTSGLNPSDLAALRALDAAANGGVAVNTLGSQLGLSSGAVTALVDRLEAHQLVRRTRDAFDRRKVLVTLAPKAQAFGAEHLKPLVRAMQTATGELEEAELAAVEHFLQLLLDAHSVTPAAGTTAPRGSRAR